MQGEPIRVGPTNCPSCGRDYGHDPDCPVYATLSDKQKRVIPAIVPTPDHLRTWTSDRHAAAKARCEATTPGEWEADASDSVSVWVGDCNRCAVAEFVHHDSDKEFIAAAHADLPAALAEIERLHKRIKELEAQREYAEVLRPQLDAAADELLRGLADAQ